MRKAFRKRKGLLRRNVTEHWALKGISFAVEYGETYGLLGPNGSGKSTMIRILSTLLEPDDGTIEVLGYRLPAQEREVRERIGRVSVDAAFYKKLSAMENLLYNAYLYNFDRQTAVDRAVEILTRLGIRRNRLYEPLEEMSRGMQQKVSIARALIINPPLLLLDEPTTGLDPKSKRDVQDFLEELRRASGTTIILTTHDMGEAERLCHRIGMLAHGRLVAEGTAAELVMQAGVANLEDAFVRFAGEKLTDDETEDVTP
ncbi:MAG TPA: ABC transporter ATP-binding protein [Bryobacteraceae bacterium]|nr:ABC transporter ATP-binding protein [Bryobacteraceae bacterium]